MKFRHEIKHEINYSDMLVLRQRLGAVMYNDAHSDNGRYEIRSIYFDTPNDNALREKIDGVNYREKFRIRYYNGDWDFIRLEKKIKQGGLCCKQSAAINKETAIAIVDGSFVPDKGSDELLTELYSKMQAQRLAAKTIVDYTREAYVFTAGNVRVTMDYNIRTGLYSTELFSDIPTAPTGDNIILEVKWDEFLPSVIKDAVTLSGRKAAAFSKYAACRIYG